MKRTISVMLGKGSVSHNTREFKATNVDVERTQYNIEYCNTPIREVYRELFDGAVERYNAKQTRADRCIDNYYEKIRTGKQEQLFKEVIFQIGNMENMSAVSEDGQLAAKMLDEFMRSFQERNPNLRVFSAHLHMDEATPHLHVDFIPFIIGSKRGLDTRVTLKQALAVQGFTGGTRGDTEWNQWVRSEKEQLSQVMERHGIEWEQLGTHETHLSVENFKKEQRIKEVAALDEQITEKTIEVSALTDKRSEIEGELSDFLLELDKTQGKLKTVKEKERFIAKNASHYDDNPKYELPEPKPMMYAKTYHDKYATPLVRRLKDVIRSILLQFIEKTQELRAMLDRANKQIQDLTSRVNRLEPENERLRGVEKEYSRVRRYLGGERTDEIVKTVKTQEIAEQQAQQQAQREIRRSRNVYAR
ncbi:MAG: plasmid recombination protein [Lachnospiraceae bacterium]|nr:plasmid recombination protein [Lachnospiraceae bacterium]